MLPFSAPARVDVVGDFMVRTVTAGREGCLVDVQLTMPDACLGTRDHVNARWVTKRSLLGMHSGQRTIVTAMAKGLLCTPSFHGYPT